MYSHVQEMVINGDELENSNIWSKLCCDCVVSSPTKQVRTLFLTTTVFTSDFCGISGFLVFFHFCGRLELTILGGDYLNEPRSVSTLP